MKISTFYRLQAILFVFVLAITFLPNKVQAQTWYNASWLYRKAITIDYTKVGTGPHGNFPVLISRADGDLQTKAQTDADDILFTSSDGTTKLSHEIESYTSASGTIVAWVEIPSLSSTANTVIYMYYGNAVAASQQDVTGTWNANFKGVYHLNNAYLDATSNNNVGTNAGTYDMPGKISRGRGFNPRDGGADYISIAGLMGSSSSITLSAWVNRYSGATENSSLIGLGDHVFLQILDNATGAQGGFYNGTTWLETVTNTSYNGAWHYAVWTFASGGNSQKIYIDGALISTTTNGGAISYSGLGANTRIGGHSNGSTSYDMDGDLDEVRVSNAVRSVGWILTEYNNQNSPSTFYSTGSEATNTKTFTGTGNFSTAARWTGGTVPVAGENLIIDGACTIDNNAGTNNIAYGTLTLGTATGRTLNWAASGTNRLNVTNFSNGAGASTLDMTNGGTLVIRGTLSPAGNMTFTPGTGTLEIQSAQTLPGAPTFNNLTINGSGITVTLGGAAALTGNLTITAGTLNTNSLNTTIAGNWINNGTFTPGAGTVTFSGTTVMSGTTATNTFNNFTLAASSTVTSSTGLTGLVVNGTLTTGASATLDLGTTTILSGTLGTISNSGTIKTAVPTTTSAIPVPAGKTWGGTLDYYNAGANQTLPGGTYNNLTVRPGNGFSVTASGNIAVNAALTVTTAFGAFDLSTYVLSGTLTSISNSGDIKTSVPTTTSATPVPAGKTWGGTIYYNATAGAQTIVGGTYNILRFLNSSGTNTAAGDLTVNNQFITTAGGTIDMGSAYRIINMGSTITNNGTVKTSVLTTTSTTPFPAGKTWTGTGTVEYAAAGGAQTVVSGTYNNLKLSNTSGTNTTGGNITVGSILTLTAGTITTGANTIYINATGTVSRTSGHVIGNLQKYIATGATSKTFEIGDATNYAPVLIAFASVTTAGDLTASTAAGDHANIGSSTIVATRTANRTWTLTNSGILFTTYSGTFTFVAGDLDGGATTGNFSVGRYSSGWTYPTVGTKTATSTQATGVTAFGDFQVGEICFAPTTSAAGADQTGATTCGLTTVTLAANAPSVGTGAWSIVSGTGGTVTTPTSATSTFSGTAGNTYTLRWTISNSPCTASIDDVVITFNQNPTTANAGADQTGAATCGLTSVTLAGNTATVGTGAWSIISGAGGTVTTPTSATSTFTGTAGTTYTLRWTISNSPCTASTDDVIITFNYIGNNLIDYINGAHGVICNTVTEGGSVTVTAPAGTVFINVAFASYGTPAGVCSTFTIGACHAATSQAVAESYLLGNNTGTIVANNSVFGDPCLGTTKQLYVQAVYTQPICSGTMPGTITGTTPTGNGSYTYLWEQSITSASAGFSAAGGTNNAKDYTPGNLTQTTWYRRTVTSAGCTNISTVIQVTVTPLPAATIAYTGSPWCATATPVSVIRTGTAGGTYTSAAGLTIDAITGTITPATSTAGTYTVTYTMAATGGCTLQTATASVTISQIPTTANAGTDQTSSATCGLTSITLAANAPSIGTGAWSIISGTGGTVTTPSSATSSFSGTAGTAYVLRWTISNSPCTASTDDVAITFNQAPTTSNAGADQTSAATCGLTTVTLAANAPSIGTGAWSIVSGTGGTVTTPTSATSTFTGVAGTTYTLRWTISNSPCTASIDDVVITFNQNPTTSNAGADQTGAATCGLTIVTLAANAASVGTGAWSIVSGTGGTVTTPTSATSTFTGAAGTAYILRWTISNSPCTASTDDVAITFNRNPTTSNAGADQTGAATCGLTTVTLAANAPSTGTGAWSIVSGTGGTVTTPTSATSTFTGAAGTAYVLRWTISNSPCTASTDDVAITFNQNPAATISYTGTPYCSNAGTATVTRTGTAGGTYTSTAGLTINSVSGDITLATSTAGVYTVTYTMVNGPCTTTATASVTITALPTATISYSGSPYCSNAGTGSVTLTGSAGGIYSSTAGLTINTSTGAIIPGTSTVGTYTVTYTMSATGGCSAQTATTSVTITTLSSATISYSGSPFCKSVGTAQTVTQTGTAGGVYSSTAGLSIDATTGEIIPATSVAGTYTVTYSMAATGGCAAQTATTSVTITPVPSATFSYPGSPYSVTAGTATVSFSGTAGGTYSSTAGLTLNTTTGDVTLSTSTPGTYTVTYTVTAAGGCSVYTTTTTITVVASTKIFTGTGNFSDPARWTGGTLPIAGENLVIDGACTVDNSVSTDNIAYGTLIIGTATGRTLSWITSGTNRLNVSNVSAGAAASTLNMTNGGTLIIRGTWASTNLTFTSGTGTIDARSTITLPAAYATYYNLIVNGSGITVTLGRATTVAGNLTITAGTLNANNFGTTAKGNWTNNVATTAFTAGTSTVTFNGTTAQAIAGTFATTFTNLTIANTVTTVTLNVNTSITGNLSVTVGTFDLGVYSANRATAGGTLSLSGNTILKIGGTNTFPINFTTNTLNVTSTVEYYGTNQTVAAKTYGNLTLSSASGAAVKTFAATAFAIVGNLTSTLGAGTSVTFTAAAILTITGNVTIGASTTFNGGSFSHNVAGNWINNGTFNGNTGTITFSGPGKGVSGPGGQNFNNLTVSASLITFSNESISLSGNLATISSGSFIQAAGGTLLMTGTTKTISGTGISLDNLTVSGTVTTAASFNVTGNLLVSGGIAASTGTITMSGSSKTISGAGTRVFAGLSVSGSITTAVNFSIANSLNVNGSFSASAGTATFTGSSTLSGTANLFNTTINGTSLQLTTNSTLGIAGTLAFTAGTLNVTSSIPNTVNFNSTGAQNINAISYNNLVLSNGNTKTAAGAITTNKDITIATGTIFSASSYTHSIYGNWINNGTFVAGTGTVQFAGPVTAYLTGATTFNILTSNTSSASTELILNDNVSAAIVNMINGIITTGSDTITITNTRTGNGFIYGNIQRNHSFTTGVAYAFEGPNNTVNFSAVSGVNSITVSAVQTAVVDFPFGNAIGRYYDIHVPSGTYTATLRLHYEDDELNGNPENEMGIWRDSAMQWIPVGKTANDTVANYVEQSGLTNISSRWTCSINPTVVLWNGSTSSDWNTAANWTVYVGSGSKPPAATDVVVLGGLATYQPTISSTVNIKNLVFVADYAVTLTMASGGSLTAGDMQGVWYSNALHTINTNGQPFIINGNMLLSDGVAGHAIDLNIGSGTVTVLGSLIQTGGANINFSSTGTLIIHENFDHSSGTFTAGNGTVIYNGVQNQHVAHVNYNNLTINKAGGLAAIDSVVNVAGNLLISAGELDNNSTTTITGNVTIATGATLQNNYMLHVGGNWLNTGTFVGSGLKTIFDGSGTQTISATTFNNVVINKPVGSVAVLTDNIVMNGDLSIISGTLNTGTFNSSRNTPGGTLLVSDSGTVIVSGNNTPVNFATVSLASSSTLIFDGTVAQTLPIPGAIGNLIFRHAGVKTLAAPILVNGNLTIENGATLVGGSQTLTLNGNWINNGTFTPSNSTIIATGIGKTISGVTTFKRFSVYGSYTLLSNLTFDSLLIINNTGSLSAASGIHVTMNGDLINSGILYTLGSTTFTGNVLQTLSLINAVQTVAITVNFNGTVSPEMISTSAPQFGYLNINNTGGVNPSVGWTIAYGLTVGSGASFNGGNSTHNILGSVTNNGTITSSGVLNFVPSSAATINVGNNFSSTGIVNFGGAGAITLAGTPVSLQDVVISNTNAAGITPVSDWSIANNFTVNSGSILNAGNHTYLVGGSVSNNGTVNSGTSTFSFNGIADQTVASMIFYNLNAMNSGGIVRLLDGTVNNNLSVTTGTLSIGNSEIIRTLSVNGNITIASGTTLNVDTASNATHLLTIGGNIINSGTLNLRPDANSLCNTTFNKVGTQTISGTGGATNFNKITVNMGVTDTNHVDVTATNFSAPNGFLTLNNGSFNLNSAAASIIPFTTDITTGNFLIPATAGLWVNAGTINSSGMNWTVAGSVKVTGGTMNMGSAINNAVIPQPAANFNVTGGNLNLASRISNPGSAWSFAMQGGTMTVNTQGSTTTGAAAFNIDATGAIFSMSGGTVIIQDAGGTTGQNLGYNNLATAGTGFTGGTLQIGNIMTTASQVFGVISTNPIYNLTVNSTNATAILQTPVLAVSNNVTVSMGTLNIDTLTLKIGGAISTSTTFIAANGTIEMNGTSAQTISAAAFQGNNLKGLTINNNAGVTLAGAINLTDVLTVSNGSLAAGGYLTLKSSATATARVAPITSVAATPISGNVIAERYVPGRRKYRLITSPVTTSTSATLTAGQEALSMWGNWQNSGINTTANVGELITGGSIADGFDQATGTASLYTYDDVNRVFKGYTTANGKNTKYTPLKAGIAYYMFVYGDRRNTVFATNPNSTVLSAKGTLKTGDQIYNTGSAIQLTGVTGRYTLLGNPFASPINWATISKTNLANSYWGWDPNLSSTGGYITVTTLGAVTISAPYSGSTGLNQYIQSGQGFFVKTTGASPVLTIREQDKVSNFNANAYRGNLTAGNIPLIAINLQYVSSGTKVLADGVLAVFDPSFSNTAGVEDAGKMANSAETISILNDTTLLSIDARKMPKTNDTLFLNVLRLTKPQYTLQIFAEEMVGTGVLAFLQDRYLNTLQPLSLGDTNNIVINVSTGIPASVDKNRFRIVFQSSVVVLPLKFISVKATPKNKDIQIDWSVAEESGVKKYEIERSVDGISFIKAGEVAARGNNTSETYNWLDVHPTTGDNYYRIRAIDVDGKFLLSKIVFVKLSTGNTSTAFKIFPNPVTNYQVNIRADEMAKGKYSLMLYNQQGQQIIQRIIDHTGGTFNQIIELSKTIPGGIYYLHIAGEAEKYKLTIFIK